MIDIKIFLIAFFAGLTFAFMAADIIQNQTVLFFSIN